MLGARWRAVILAAAVAAALLPVGAAAHPYLVSATPTAGATVPTSPGRITIFYTEELDAPYSVVSLVGPDGHEVSAQVSSSGSRLVATLPPLGAGTWVVNWTVVGEDGHRVVGDYAFNVAHASANAAAGTVGSGYADVGDVSPLELVGRALLGVLTVVLAGLLLLGFVVLPRDPEARPRAGARLSRLRTGVWMGQLVLVAALAGLLIRWNGVDTLLSSVTGKLVVLRGLLTLALAPAVLDAGALAAGRPPDRRTGAYGAAVAAMLLGALALSGHALAAPDHRTLELTVLGVHLLSISLWVGAIVAVVAGTAGIRTEVPARQRFRAEAGRFTPLVALCIALMLVTGVYNAGVNLRAVGELAGSTYGRVLDVKVTLVLLMVALGLAGAVWRRRTDSSPPGTRRRLSWVLGRRAQAVEATVAVLVLSLAGVLAQEPNPVSFPYPSQADPQLAGTPLFTASNGTHLIPVTVSPGLPGPNRIISTVQRNDDNDLPVPLEGVTSIDLVASCACAPRPLRTTLQGVTGGPWFAGDVNLAAGTWTFELHPHLGAATEASGSGTAHIVPLSQPHQVLMGIAADLSGAGGQACQDRAIGVQAAAIEANENALADGDVVRAIALDTRSTGPAGAVERLAGMHAALLAVPCGDAATVAAITAAAAGLHLPVVGALQTAGHHPGVWSTGPEPASEGTALADQAVYGEHGRSAIVLAGNTAAETEEAAATAAEFQRLGVPFRRMPIELGCARGPHRARARAEPQLHHSGRRTRRRAPGDRGVRRPGAAVGARPQCGGQLRADVERPGQRRGAVADRRPHPLRQRGRSRRRARDRLRHPAPAVVRGTATDDRRAARLRRRLGDRQPAARRRRRPLCGERDPRSGDRLPRIPVRGVVRAALGLSRRRRRPPGLLHHGLHQPADQPAAPRLHQPCRYLPEGRRLRPAQ